MTLSVLSGWLLIATLSIAVPAAAQDKAPAPPKPPRCPVLDAKRPDGTIDKSPFGAGVYLEQDGVLPWLSPWNEDRNYTMGLAFPLMGQWVHRTRLDGLLTLADCLTGFNRRHNARIGQGDTMQDFALVFGHTAFTPDRLNTREPIFDDRPYASLLFLSAVRSTINAQNRSVLRTEFTLGVLGLGIAESVQTDIHTANRRRSGKLTPYDPLGWSHQISDGGEVTAKYTVSVADAATESMWHDLSWHGEASAGYYTNAAGGALLRVGRLRSPFWALSTNPVTAANQRARQPGDPLKAKLTLDERRAMRKVEALLFGAGRLRVVGYNALLQGQFRHSDVTLRSTDISHLVIEVEAGASIGVGPCSVVGTVARRTAEYRVGVPRPHTFGGVHLVCAGARGKS